MPLLARRSGEGWWPRVKQYLLLLPIRDLPLPIVPLVSSHYALTCGCCYSISAIRNQLMTRDEIDIHHDAEGGVTSRTRALTSAADGGSITGLCSGGKWRIIIQVDEDNYIEL